MQKGSSPSQFLPSTQVCKKLSTGGRAEIHQSKIVEFNSANSGNKENKSESEALDAINFLKFLPPYASYANKLKVILQQRSEKSAKNYLQNNEHSVAKNNPHSNLGVETKQCKSIKPLKGFDDLSCNLTRFQSALRNVCNKDLQIRKEVARNCHTLAVDGQVQSTLSNEEVSPDIQCTVKTFADESDLSHSSSAVRSAHGQFSQCSALDTLQTINNESGPSLSGNSHTFLHKMDNDEGLSAFANPLCATSSDSQTLGLYGQSRDQKGLNVRDENCATAAKVRDKYHLTTCNKLFVDSDVIRDEHSKFQSDCAAVGGNYNVIQKEFRLREVAASPDSCLDNSRLAASLPLEEARHSTCLQSELLNDSLDDFITYSSDTFKSTSDSCDTTNTRVDGLNSNESYVTRLAHGGRRTKQKYAVTPPIGAPYVNGRVCIKGTSLAGYAPLLVDSGAERSLLDVSVAIALFGQAYKSHLKKANKPIRMFSATNHRMPHKGFLELEISIGTFTHTHHVGVNEFAKGIFLLGNDFLLDRVDYHRGRSIGFAQGNHDPVPINYHLPIHDGHLTKSLVIAPNSTAMASLHINELNAAEICA